MKRCLRNKKTNFGDNRYIKDMAEQWRKSKRIEIETARKQLLPLFQAEAYREYPGTQVRRLTAAEIEKYMAERE